MADERDSTKTDDDPMTRSAEVVGNIIGNTTRVVVDAAQNIASAATRTAQSAAETASQAAGAAAETAQSVGTSAAGLASGAAVATAAPRRAVRRTVRRAVKQVKATGQRVAKAVARTRKSVGASRTKKIGATRVGQCAALVGRSRCERRPQGGGPGKTTAPQSRPAPQRAARPRERLVRRPRQGQGRGEARRDQEEAVGLTKGSKG